MSQAGPLDPTHLSLGIGLQPEQTAHLQGLRLDDASPHKVFRVGVHVVQESRAKPQKLRRKRGARPVSSQTVARQFPKPISQKGEGEVQRDGAATAPHIPEPEQGRLGCLTPISHLGLGDFWVHGVVGFEDFLRLLLGAEAGKRGVRAPPPQLWAAHPGPAVAPPPAAAHRLSCFQRWKKSWAAISVGWKNLLMVTGSFRVRDWGAPPYLARKEEDSIRSRPSPRSPEVPPAWPTLLTHRKRTDKKGGARKSRRHSILSTCCTCAPPSTCAATRLVCTASCAHRR